MSKLHYLMISIVSVTVVGVEVVLALQRVSGADPCLTTGYRQVLQTKLPISAYDLVIVIPVSSVWVLVLPSNLAKKTASPLYM